MLLAQVSEVLATSAGSHGIQLVTVQTSIAGIDHCKDMVTVMMMVMVMMVIVVMVMMMMVIVVVKRRKKLDPLNPLHVYM